MKITSRKNKTLLDREIEDVLIVLSTLEKWSPKYTATTNNLERLYKAKATTAESKIKPDTVILVAANLAGILLILNYEKLDSVTSKALSFVARGRV